MPLSKIEIEQTAPDRWTAEVEVGGWVAKRRVVRGESFVAVMAAVDACYVELAGEMRPTIQEMLERAMKTDKPRRMV